MTDWYCDRCRQRHICTYLKLNKVTRQNDFCPPLMDKIDGNTPCKEPLASEIMGAGYEGFANLDYKEVLSALCSGKAMFVDEYRGKIEGMPTATTTQINIKVVACLLWFGVPATVIMRVFRIGKTKFYAMIKEKPLEVRGKRE